MVEQSDFKTQHETVLHYTDLTTFDLVAVGNLCVNRTSLSLSDPAVPIDSI